MVHDGSFLSGRVVLRDRIPSLIRGSNGSVVVMSLVAGRLLAHSIRLSGDLWANITAAKFSVSIEFLFLKQIEFEI